MNNSQMKVSLCNQRKEPANEKRKQKSLKKTNRKVLKEKYYKKYKKFCAEYEKNVGDFILPKLPKLGVLESALKFLKEFSGSYQKELSKDDSSPLFMNGIERMKKDAKLLFGDELGDKFFFDEKSPATEFYRKTTNTELGNFYKRSQEIELENRPSKPNFLDTFCLTANSPDAFEPFDKKFFHDPDKEFKINTPPVLFYRRNMF